MPARRIRIKCVKCGSVNRIPFNEMSFRVNDDGRVLCARCCKEKRWESPVCKGCSDRTICMGEFAERMRKFIQNIDGI